MFLPNKFDSYGKNRLLTKTTLCDMTTIEIIDETARVTTTHRFTIDPVRSRDFVINEDGSVPVIVQIDINCVLNACRTYPFEMCDITLASVSQPENNGIIPTLGFRRL